MAIEDQVVNKFILYYLIDDFWKEKSLGSIHELHKLLFPSKKNDGGVRSAYDAILRFDNYDLTQWLVPLEEKSGISSRIWSGEEKLKTGIADVIWQQFIDARIKRRNANSNQYNKIEFIIKQSLRVLYADTSRQSSTVKALLFFLEYREKKVDDALDGRLQAIEADIERMRPSELSKVDRTRLTEYLNNLSTHAKRVAAIIELKEWTNS